MRNLRAWDISQKKMNKIRGYVDNGLTVRVFRKDGGFASYPKDKIIIFYGSGVLDKNGVEVFDGDILSQEVEVDGEIINNANQVVFENGSYWVDISYKQDKRYLEILCEKNNFKISGNIYDNQGLLK